MQKKQPHPVKKVSAPKKPLAYGLPQQTSKGKPSSLAKRRRKKLRWGRVLMVTILAAGLGYVSFWTARAGLPQLYTKLRSDWQQVSSAPLPYSNRAYHLLTSEITAYLQKQPKGFAVAGTDLATGVAFGVHQNQVVNAAQMTALPVSILLYSDIAQGIIHKNAIVTLQASDRQAGPGYVSGMPVGTTFTVTQLARAAIVDNDVTAIAMLIRFLGSDQINSFMTTMGTNSSILQPHLTTPYDYSLYLDYLYTMDQAHPQAVRPLLNDLTVTPSEGRIATIAGADIQVAHVLGNWPHEFHDASIIWVNGHPVTLVITSDGVTSQQAATVESHIARLVVQFEKKGY